MVHDDRSWSECDVNGVHGLSNGKRTLTLCMETESIGVDTPLALVGDDSMRDEHHFDGKWNRRWPLTYRNLKQIHTTM